MDACGKICRALCKGSLRYPLLSSARGVHFEEITRYTLSTDDNGRAATVVQVGSGPDLYWFGTFTGDIVTAWGGSNASRNYSSINTEFTNKSVTSAAIEANYIHSSFENEGRLAVKTMRPQGLGNNKSLTTEPFGYGQAAPVEGYGPLKKGAFVLCTPGDSHAYQPFHVDSATAEIPRGWGRSYFFVEGAKPNTAVLEIVVRVQLWLEPEGATFASRLAEPPMPSNPQLRGAINAAYAKINAEEGSITMGDVVAAGKAMLPYVRDAFHAVPWAQLATFAGVSAPTLAY